jgi:Chaperone of endosialidase
MAMWLTTGTISVTNGSTTVTGVGTTFSQAKVGSELMLRTGAPPDGGPVTGPPYEVTSIASDLSLTIFPAYGGTTASGQTYALRPISFSMEKDLIDRIDQLLTKIDGLMFTAGNDRLLALDRPVLAGNADTRYKTTGVDKWQHGLITGSDDWQLQRWTGSVWETALNVPISGPVTIVPNNSIASAQIIDGTIVAGDIADNTITSAKLLDNTLQTGKIADGAITSLKIADGTIQTADIADGAITSAKIAELTISVNDIAPGSINSAKIADGTIEAVDLSTTLNATINGKLAKTGTTSGDIMTGDLQITKDFAAAIVNTNNQPNAPRYSWRVGNTERWLATLTIAESGANSGSALSFQGFSDGGSFVIEAMRLVRANGNMFVGGAAFKPGGGSWIDSSDVRIKDNIHDYTSGLAEILKLRPRTFTYKPETRRNTTQMHVGLIAQECEKVMPELVRQEATPIGDIHFNDMRIFDSTALTYALVNAVKELAQRVEDLETEI